MAAENVLCKAGLWALAICMVLNLQVTEAQSNSTATVPGWGIALLVLTSLILLALLCYLCCLPFLCKRQDSCQSGFCIGK